MTQRPHSFVRIYEGAMRLPVNGWTGKVIKE